MLVYYLHRLVDNAIHSSNAVWLYKIYPCILYHNTSTMLSEAKFEKDLSRSYLELQGAETEIKEWFEEIVLGVQKKM